MTDYMDELGFNYPTDTQYSFPVVLPLPINIPPSPLNGIYVTYKNTSTIVVAWSLLLQLPPAAGVYYGTRLFITTTNTAPIPTTPGGIDVANPDKVYNFLNLNSNTTYYIFAYAYNNSGFSTVVSTSAKTDPDPDAPPFPVEFLVVDAVSSNSINVSWNLSASGGLYAGASVYILPNSYTQPQPVLTPGIIVNTPTLTYTFTGLSPQTNYYIWVFAFNSTGFATGATVSARTAGGAITQFVPSPVNFRTTGNNGYTVDLLWNAQVGVTGYYIYQGSTNVLGQATKYTLSTTPISSIAYSNNLRPSTRYFFWLQAYLENSSIGIATSTIVPITPGGYVDMIAAIGPPGPPTNLNVKYKTDTTLTLAWEKAISGGVAIDYYVYINVVNDFNTAQPYGPLGTGLLYYQFAFLGPSTQYYFWVTGVAGIPPVQGPPGGPLIATTLSVAPLPPNPLSTLSYNPVTVTENSVDVGWTFPVAGAESQGAKLFITTINSRPDPTTSPGGVVLDKPTDRYTFAGLTGGIVYYLWGFSFNTAGYSSDRTVSFQTAPSPPDPPVSITIVRNPNNQNNTLDTYTISWVSATVSSGVLLYLTTTKYRPLIATSPTPIAWLPKNSSYTLSNLTQGITYYVWLYSFLDVVGYSSFFSLTATGKSFQVYQYVPRPISLTKYLNTTIAIIFRWGALYQGDPNIKYVLNVWRTFLDNVVYSVTIPISSDLTSYVFTYPDDTPLLAFMYANLQVLNTGGFSKGASNTVTFSRGI